ncbi:MAG: MBL fold metallo-hydrolase [Alicyclobacillus sp.]|nr:MBL fold metallo-hydrolase [Alicyclobacillus sp.]
MEKTDEAKNVWASHSTDLFSNTFPIIAYFVRQPDGLTLIETGIKSGAKVIIAAAKCLQTHIVQIVLANSHGDHAGSLHTSAA